MNVANFSIVIKETFDDDSHENHQTVKVLVKEG